MCGRFACYLCPKDLREQISQDYNNIETIPIGTDNFSPSYNIAPSQSIPVIYEDRNGQYHFELMQWGFISNLVKETSIRPTNIRKETLLNPTFLFDRAKKDRRCIIVAQGFYEWKSKGNKKVPFYTKRKDGKLMLFAGLYDIHNFNGYPKYTCAICTTKASDFFSKIHTRMPCILEQKDIKSWLSKDVRWTDELTRVLRPYQGELDCFRVTDKANSTSNNDADLIKPLDESKDSIFKFLAKQDSILPEKSTTATPTAATAETTTTTKTKTPSLPNTKGKVVKKKAPTKSRSSSNGLLKLTDYFSPS